VSRDGYNHAQGIDVNESGMIVAGSRVKLKKCSQFEDMNE
jgi:hypothetical protein